ncbi:response regulator [bacterium]|nr:response regulator [bacterium]
MKGKVLLVIDDDPVYLQALEYYCRNMGADVVTAEDGAQGVELFDQHEVFLVLSDLSMPKVDGIELARRIRSRDAGVPIIAITGHYHLDEIKLREAGIQALLTKPFHLHELQNTMEQVLLRNR